MDETRLEHKFIETNGVRLHVVLAGPADGPLLILLHGFPEFWYGWRRQIEPLAQAGFRVVVPDQRGYNLSEKPDGVNAYAIDVLARDVTGLIEALGRQQACLAGHDWGAAVAWHTAARYPERVQKLVILNVPHPAVMIDTLRRSPRQLLKSWYIFFFQLRGLAEWMLGRGDYSGLVNMLKASAKEDTFSTDDLESYRAAYRQPGALTGMLNWYRAMFQAGLRNQRNPEPLTPRNIKVPTLVLWGVRDIALSKELAQPSVNQCQQGQLVFFENATHWLQHDEPEAVSEAIRSFCR